MIILPLSTTLNESRQFKWDRVVASIENILQLYEVNNNDINS